MFILVTVNCTVFAYLVTDRDKISCCWFQLRITFGTKQFFVKNCCCILIRKSAIRGMCIN